MTAQERDIKKRSKKFERLSSVSVPTETVFHIILGTFALACIIPFIFVVIISFSAESSISNIGYSFFPQAFSLEAYKRVFEMGDVLWRSLFNSVVVTLIGTSASVLICILYSYILFRKDFKYRKFFMYLSFITMIFGGGLAPTVIVSQKILGMGDNYWALICPLLVSPFNFIIMRTFFQSSVPEALIEAAQVDGSGEYRTLFQIICPIALPGIATVSLLNMLAYWNDWFLAQLYLTSSKYVPLQYLLVEMQKNAEYMALHAGTVGATVTDMPTESLRMALCVIIVIPIAFAYPFFQRYIVSGLTVGSVKG